MTQEKLRQPAWAGHLLYNNPFNLYSRKSFQELSKHMPHNWPGRSGRFDEVVYNLSVKFIHAWRPGERVFGKVEEWERDIAKPRLLWEGLAYWMLTTEQREGITIDPFQASVSEDRFTGFLNNYFTDYWTVEKPDLVSESVSVCKKAIDMDGWPITHDRGRYYFKKGPHNTPHIFYFLVADHFLRSDLQALPEAMEQIGTRSIPNDLIHYPLYSFIAQRLFSQNRGEELENFVLGLARHLGGERGYAITAQVITELITQNFYPREYALLTQDKPEDLQEGTESQRKILDKMEETIQKEYMLLAYKDRPRVIGPDILARAAENPAAIWDEIFEKEGVQQEAEKLFGGIGNSDIRRVYETAMRERKMIPGLIMIFAHAFGFSQQDAKRLATLAFFAWGDIVSYDDIVDGHMVRKGYPTDLAEAGLALATGRTMLGIADLLYETLDEDSEGVFLTRGFLKMLRNSVHGDIDSRELKWSDSDETYLENMRSLIEAFSWYPDYMGERNGMIEAGIAFRHFLAATHCLGQMNNDIEDLDPPNEKHEPGHDIGLRISLYWKHVVELLEARGLNKEAGLVKQVYEAESKRRLARRDRFTAEQEQFEVVLGIGRKYKKEVILSLYPAMKKIYQEAQVYLLLGFQGLPDFDDINQQFHGILFKTLDFIWWQFCQYGEIEEI